MTAYKGALISLLAEHNSRREIMWQWEAAGEEGCDGSVFLHFNHKDLPLDVFR